MNNKLENRTLKEILKKINTDPQTQMLYDSKLNRVMNFIEYNFVSNFYLKLIYIISINILFMFSSYVIKIKPEWNKIIGILLIFNSFAVLTLFV